MISDDGMVDEASECTITRQDPRKGRERPPHDTLFPSQNFSYRNTTGKKELIACEFDQRLGVACPS